MKRLFTENFWIKLASLSMSIALWLFVGAKSTTIVTMDIPVNTANVPTELVLVSKSPSYVQIKLEGQERLLKNVLPSDIKLNANLEGVTANTKRISLAKDDFKLPPLIRLREMEPSSIEVKLEKKVIRTLKVSPVITGQPAKGYKILRIESTPEEVYAEGQKDDMAGLKTLKTALIDVTGASETVIEEAVLDKRGLSIDIRPDEVTVKVVIAKEE